MTHVIVTAFQTTGSSTAYSIASDWQQRRHQSSAILALCEGNPPVTGGFPSQWASNEESVPILWRHNGEPMSLPYGWRWCRRRPLWYLPAYTSRRFCPSHISPLPHAREGLGMGHHIDHIYLRSDHTAPGNEQIACLIIHFIQIEIVMS